MSGELKFVIGSNTMNSSRGLGRGRGRGSRPGPPSWPHGTTPEDRRNFTPNKSAEIREPPEVDWDEIRHRVGEIVLNLYVTQRMHPCNLPPQTVQSIEHMIFKVIK